MLKSELLGPWECLREVFRTLVKPTRSSGCGCSFCLTEPRILALLDIDADQLADTHDVRVYLENVLGTIGSDEDFRFLLPGLMRIWAEKLDQIDPSDAYREHFWAALARQEFFAVTLAPDLQSAASEFLRTVLLARLGREGPLSRINGQQGPHCWTDDLFGYARVSEDFELLWKEWWAFPKAGHAVAAVQVASCLAFESQNNPIFHKWTPLGGGGPPGLNEIPGPWPIYWIDTNLAFIRRSLTVPFLESALVRASALLQNPLADAVLDAVRGDADAVAERIRALTQ
jgi:hypothetical protein